MKIFFTICLLLNVVFSVAQKPAYQLFTANGELANYNQLVELALQHEIFLFGEQHDNAIAHWLQYELTKDLFDAHKNLILGAEMFEADNQDELNQYLDGEIEENELDSLARLWPNYYTDYAPLVNFAKENQLPFIATNIPRRFANLVYKNDFEILDSLSIEEKSWIAPLPIRFDPELPGYQKILHLMSDHGSLKLVKAQAIKDATMAHFILENRPEQSIFLHFNGAWHSDDYNGITWYLQQENSAVNVLTISTVTQPDISKLQTENFGLADIIICVDEDVTKTY